MRHLPTLRTALALAVLLSATTAFALCRPPDDTLDWRMVGEIVQNTRTTRLSTNRLSGWSTVASVANLGSFDRRETLSASFSENQIVTYAIRRWGIGTNFTSTRTHRVSVTVQPRTRVRLVRQRREEIRDLTWDVVCAWQNTVTGRSAITLYGRGYTGTFWHVYDAFEVRTEPV